MLCNVHHYCLSKNFDTVYDMFLTKSFIIESLLWFILNCYIFMLNKENQLQHSLVHIEGDK